MIRPLSAALLALTFVASLAEPLAVPLVAQAPEGLRVRVDRSIDPADPDDVPDISVRAVPNGIRVTTGPAVMLWRDDQRATGNYTLSARFTLEQPSGHRNYYGLVFGGRNLQSENQWYLYFMVAQTGQFVIINRIDNVNTNSLVSHTENAAIRRPDASGRSVNDLAVRVSANRIEFVVNGTVVHAADKTGALLDTNGNYGVRINHVLPGVVVENLTVTPM